MGCQGCNDSAACLCMPVDKCKMHTSPQSSVQPAHATHTHTLVGAGIVASCSSPRMRMPPSTWWHDAENRKTMHMIVALALPGGQGTLMDSCKSGLSLECQDIV